MDVDMNTNEIDENIANACAVIAEYTQKIASLKESVSIYKGQKCRVMTNGNHNYIDDRDHNVIYYYQPKQKKCSICDHVLVKDL